MNDQPARTPIIDYFANEFASPMTRMFGWRLEHGDEAEGTMRVAFTPSADHCNPVGDVQGGMLAAMIDEVMGTAVIVKSGGELYPATVQLDVQYLKSVKPGTVRVEAKCVQLGRTVAFVHASLFDGDGALAATAISSARVKSMPRAEGEMRT